MGSLFLDVYDGLFCQKMQFFPYSEFVNDMVAKEDIHKKTGKDLLQAFLKILTWYMVGIIGKMLTINLNVVRKTG